MMKRIVNVLLILALLLGMLAVPASAANTSEAGGYYLIGDMNGWELSPSFKLRDDGGIGYSYPYLPGIQGTETFQIVYSEDGKTVQKVYPDENRRYNEDGRVFIYGAWDWYELLFSPDGNVQEGRGGAYVYDDNLAVNCVEPPEEEPTSEFLFFDKFDTQYHCNPGEYWCYEELYYHLDADGETDWVLLFAATNGTAPWIFGTVIGNRVIKKDGWDVPFTTNFGLYDVKNDKFIDVNNENMNGRNFNPADYPDFVRVFDEYASQTKDYEVNRLLGDLDGDDEISVVDATIIQRCEANMRSYPEDDEMISLDYSSKIKPAYFSDFNRDGERDILDATCIQRYLANLPYPIG